MKVRTYVLLSLLALILGVSATRRPANDIRTVTFDVAVHDKNGNPVVGLQRSDFRVFENNVEQTITSFRLRKDPLAIVILAELSDTYYLADAIKPAEALIRSLQPQDWAALVTFDSQPEIVVDFTHDKSALLAGLHELQMPYSHEPALYDALYFVLDRLNRIEGLEEKKAICLLGTGRDTASFRRSYGDVLKKAAASGTVIYAVGLEQSPGTASYSVHEPGSLVMTNQAGNNLRDIAQATGGVAFLPQFGGQYDAIPRIVSADLRHQYTLSFVSPNARANGKLHRIRVEVADTDVNDDGKPDKLRTRHQEGYYE